MKLCCVKCILTRAWPATVLKYIPQHSCLRVPVSPDGAIGAPCTCSCLSKHQGNSLMQGDAMSESCDASPCARARLYGCVRVNACVCLGVYSQYITSHLVTGMSDHASPTASVMYVGYWGVVSVYQHLQSASILTTVHLCMYRCM